MATGIVFIYTLAATAATFTIKTANAAFVFFLLDLVRRTHVFDYFIRSCNFSA